MIIFDNCEKIEDISPKFIPKTSGSVIFTSRNPTTKLGDSARIQLKPFTEDEGLELLRKLLGNSNTEIAGEDVDALRKLLKRVAGLPLGIQQLAVLMNDHELPIREFLTFYERYARQLLKEVGRAEDYDGDRNRKVGTEHILDNIWRLSFESLKPSESCLLGVMAFLSPDVIPIHMFSMTGVVKERAPEVLSFCGDDFR